MKTLLLILSGIILISAPVEAQISETGYFEYLKEASELRSSKTIKFLIQEINHFLHAYPDAANADEALYILANLYEEQKKYPEAFLCLAQIKFIHPRSEISNDAVTSLNQLVHNKAEKTFRDKRLLIDEAISAPISFTNRANAYYDYLNFIHTLDLPKTNALLVAEINNYLGDFSRNTKNGDQLIFWVGGLHEKSKDWIEAVQTYRKLSHVAPDSPLFAETLFRIGYLQYEETNQPEQARDVFVDLIANHAETVFAGDGQFFLAELYDKKLGNDAEAVSNYRLLVETYPRHKNAVEALKRVADIKKKNDKYEEAIATYHQIFELYPDDAYAPEALLNIETLYRRQLKNFEKAIEILKLYSDRFTEKKDAAKRLFDAAELYRKEIKNKQAAIDTYHEVINKFPDSKEAKKAQGKIEDLTKE